MPDFADERYTLTSRGGTEFVVTPESAWVRISVFHASGQCITPAFSIADVRAFAEFILKHTEIEEASDPDGDATDA